MKRVRKLLKRKFKEALFANKNKLFLPGANIITLESLEPRLLLSTMWVDMDTGDEFFHATDGNDIFFGDTFDNIADGLGGDDMLYGMGGNDILQGGPGSDVIYGSHHDDRLFGGDGNDILYGNWGEDVLDGGAGDDQLFGGRQRDVLISGAGDDFMDGEKQNDTFLFTGSQNGDVKTVLGGHGNDTIDLTEFEAGSVVQNGSTITVSLGDSGIFQINYQSVENILIVSGPVNELSIENVSLQEGDNGVTLFDFTVSLSHSALTPVMVDFATANDSAISGLDYHSNSGILTFTPGVMTKTIQVPVVGDTDVEADEFFFVNLSNPNNAVITDGQAVGTIINDDTLVPTLSIDDTAVVEGDNGTVNAVFTVSLSSASTEIITVDFATADDSATSGSDYQAISGALTFSPGVTTQNIQVPVIGDTDVEPDEPFFLNLTNPSNTVITDNRAEGIIINDDVLVPTLSIDDASIIEGDQGAVNAAFMVSLSSPSLVPITVDFSLANDTAISGLDYAALNGTLIFHPGVTTRNIQVPVIGDTDAEPDETFFVNLTNAGNVIIDDNQALGTISNDDTLVPTLSIEDASVVEGDNGTVDAVFVVSLSSPSSVTVTVDFATADDSAASGSDYQATSDTLTFSPGVTTQTIEVPVIGDTDVELDEMFFINLNNPDHALITDNQAVGTIINDDIPTLYIEDISVIEGDNGTIDAVFAVNLTSTSPVPIMVDFSTTEDNATSGLDYAALGGTLVFSPGVTTQTIEVPVVGDTDVELDEMFFVNLDNPDNALLADNQAVGTIINDDDVEIIPQEITVLLSPDEITDGQISPVIDLGAVVEGQYESHLTFIVRNDGDQTLTLGDIVLPAGYSLSEGLVSSLQAGEFDAFTVQLDTAQVGVKAGQISFSNNDSDENPYNFAITGTVIGPEITLLVESIEITDEQAAVVNFGSVLAGQANPNLTFTIGNDGAYVLLLDNVALPNGFSFGADTLVAGLAPGESDTFSVMMAGDNVATHSGQMIITNNDSDEGLFEVPLGGVIWDIISIKPKKSVVQFADLDGRLTNVMLKGPGTMEIQSSVTALPTVALTDTTVKSKLIISGAHKRAESTLYDVFTAGQLKMIKGKKTDLQGNIMAGNLKMLILDDINENSSVIIAEPNKGFILKADDVADNVNFDINDRVLAFKTSTYAGGSLNADSIRSVHVRFGALGADVTSRVAEIGSVKALKAIQGDIISQTFIKNVISKTQGLASDAVIIAQNGNINKARFAGDVAGKVMAQGQIKRLVSPKGTFTGVAGAHERIGAVRFHNIEGAVISSYGDIKAVKSKDSIMDSYILAGYDIGGDGQLGGPVEDIFNQDGATITSIKTAGTGNFDGSIALAGVRPFFDANTNKWGPGPEGQRVTADFGEIKNVKLGQVWEGNSDDPYGLFAATNIKIVKITETLPGSGAPDFQIWP